MTCTRIADLKAGIAIAVETMQKGRVRASCARDDSARALQSFERISAEIASVNAMAEQVALATAQQAGMAAHIRDRMERIAGDASDTLPLAQLDSESANRLLDKADGMLRQYALFDVAFDFARTKAVAEREAREKLAAQAAAAASEDVLF